MPIGPVHWGSYPGELLEEAMAVLLFQERPDAWRREPSQGDGGVDIAQPVVDGYHIFQVKRFAKQPTSNQRKQIEHSYHRLKDDPSLDQPVAHWSLVLPVDWTAPSEKWFRKLTAEAGFECDWLGKVFWDSEAAKHPYVIDYFFEDGKERLKERVRTLGELIRDPEEKIRPTDIGTALGNLSRELNDADPYYRYDFRVTSAPPEQRSDPRVLTTATRRVGPSAWVAFDVIAKWPGAVVERPITGGFSYTVFDADEGIDLREQYQAHVDYGAPLKIPPGAVKGFHLDLPGGLADGFSETAQIEIGARRPIKSEPKWIDLEILDGKSTTLSRALLPVTDESVGQKGAQLRAADLTGLIRFEMLLSRPDNLKGRIIFSVEASNLAGRPVSVVGGAIRLLANYHAGNMFQLSIRTSFSLFTTGGGVLEQDAMSGWELAVAYLDILEELQRSTPVPLLVASSIDEAYWMELVRVRDLLRGERIDATWSNGSLVVDNNAVEAIKAAILREKAIWKTSPLLLPNGDSSVVFGVYRQTVTDIRIKSIRKLNSEHTRISLEPGPGAEAWETLAGPT